MADDSIIAERYAPEDPAGESEIAERSIATPISRLWSKPLLPEAGAAGAPLTAVIAAISFLATLTLAAFLVISTTASVWTEELKTAFTVQVKGPDAPTIAANTDEVVRILSSTQGVIETNVVDADEAAKLLEPWLGTGNIGDYLNVPAIVEVRATDGLRNDLELLQARLTAAAPGAVIDNHGEWHSRLVGAARSGQLLAFAVFTLVMGAACAIAIFAARAGLAANEKIVSLLHLIGATDQFIANEVQRRFVVLGLRGSIAGLIVALLALGATGALAETIRGDQFFLPILNLKNWHLGALLIVPIILCLVTAISARWTVLKTLARSY